MDYIKQIQQAIVKQAQTQAHAIHYKMSHCYFMPWARDIERSKALLKHNNINAFWTDVKDHASICRQMMADNLWPHTPRGMK